MLLNPQLINASDIELLTALLGNRRTAEALLRNANGSLFSLFHQEADMVDDLFCSQGIVSRCRICRQSLPM